MKLLNCLSLFASLALSQTTSQTVEGDSFVHPISIDGKHFIDSITQERFYIKGVDYQPGGAAAYNRDKDPLSDADTCARDVYLMQQLGINTVRVYTVNPELHHDDCMTMLAAANIYLLLDVNSPLVSESINRYEPWTTYTPEYLRHVFQVVDKFSKYNNTLAFFIGNEIVNDERSAAVSPPYIRAVTRDVKDYMYYNCPRSVPIGYSAADDLKYRTQLPDYLTCGARDSAIDFYGVNSYQWCGYQTMATSGYDTLIKDHAAFDFPIFLSEFGCNHIQPRPFQEVEAIYSSEMTPYFDGGLVYEFTQETNNYGLVDIEANGNARIRPDFKTLKTQFAKVSIGGGIAATEMFPNQTMYSNSTNSQKPSGRTNRYSKKTPECQSEYSNLSGAKLKIPDSFGTDMIRNGVKVGRGGYNRDLLHSMQVTNFSIFDNDSSTIAFPQIDVVNNFSLHSSETVWTPRYGKQSGLTESKPQQPGTEKKIKNHAPPRNGFYVSMLVGILALLVG